MLPKYLKPNKTKSSTISNKMQHPFEQNREHFGIILKFLELSKTI